MKQGYRRSTVAAAVVTGSLVASTAIWAEVYRWTDENGVTHFSQTPPSTGQEAVIEDVPETEAAEGQASGAGIDFDGPGMAADPEMSAADLRRQEIAQSIDQRQSEQAALAALCREAASRLEKIEPNRRIYYTNEEGETVRMDDEQRVAEVERLRAILNANCR